MLRRMQEPEAYEPQINEAAFEALQMAIEALKTQDATDTNVGDTIYRQAAIDAMEGLPKYFDKTDTLCLDYADVLAVLSEHLPSAQPEIIRCKDCRHGVDYYHEGDCYCSNPKWGLTYFGGSWEFYCADAERRTISRLIDADALIEKAHHEAQGMSKPFKEQFGVLVEWLVEKTPTIDTKPKWIPCSERLPEEHIGFYLVTVQKRRITALNVVGCDNTIHDIDIARWDYDRRAPQRGYHWCKADKVIAWMPLPEPYRGDKK